MDHYKQISFGASKIITKAYSTSFSLGIMAFTPKYREPIYGIYGFVRIADEIVDTFHGFDKEKLLADFKKDTMYAIENGISVNPVINAFQKTIRDYKIDIALVEAFLESMRMDIFKSTYEANQYNEYIFGSAEAVGLMCLKIFVDGDENEYNRLKYSAKALGSAFQKVNFLRDIKSDLDERGRIYLPDAVNNEDITDINKQNLEKEIENEFNIALEGIKQLPAGVKLGVYSAYLYYRKLFDKIKEKEVKQLLKKRIRVSNFRKVVLLLKSFLEVKILKTCQVKNSI